MNEFFIIWRIIFQKFKRIVKSNLMKTHAKFKYKKIKLNSMEVVDLNSLSELEQKALAEAEFAMNNTAHPFISHFHVGAASLTMDGKIYSGSNQESSALSLAMCGERNAIFHALADRSSEIETIVIITRGEDFDTVRASPSCGACRQWLYDVSVFAERDIKLIFASTKKTHIIRATASELLPYPYSQIIHGKDMTSIDNIFGQSQMNLTKFRQFNHKYQKLIQQAENAWKNSYCPYSGAKEGIAALMSDNNYLSGKTIENAAYGSSTSAVSGLISEVHSHSSKKITGVAYVVGKENGVYRVAGPDGNSRQQLFEISNGTKKDFDVILFTPDKKQFVLTKMSALLPYAFGPGDLGMDVSAYFGNK
jgi:cytidine deaminase